MVYVRLSKIEHSFDSIRDFQKYFILGDDQVKNMLIKEYEDQFGSDVWSKSFVNMLDYIEDEIGEESIYKTILNAEEDHYSLELDKYDEWNVYKVNLPKR